MSGAATLLRWLGPWASARAPAGIERRTETVGGRLTAYRFVARRPRGAYLVTPGLHPLGPLDPRLDRFCRVLAAAGFEVLAPALPDHLAVQLAPSAAGDLALAFEHLARDFPRPAIFSISFGSLPALAVAARPDVRDRVAALLVFGGFFDFADAAHFALTGAHADPTNAPAALLNVLPFLRPAGDREPLRAALHLACERTWGRPELKRPGARDGILRAIAATLPENDRQFFLQSCLLEPGGAELFERGRAAAGAAFAFADPRPLLQGLRCPIAIVHGRDDDVIPSSHAEQLFAALPAGAHKRLYLTGMYGHTGALLPSPAALARELSTMLRIVRALSGAPLGRPFRIAE